MAIETPISLGLSWTLTKPFGSGYRHLLSPRCTSLSDTCFASPLPAPVARDEGAERKSDVMVLDTWLFNVSLLDIYTNHDFI